MIWIHLLILQNVKFKQDNAFECHSSKKIRVYIIFIIILAVSVVLLSITLGHMQSRKRKTNLRKVNVTGISNHQGGNRRIIFSIRTWDQDKVLSFIISASCTWTSWCTCSTSCSKGIRTRKASVNNVDGNLLHCLNSIKRLQQ